MCVVCERDKCTLSFEVERDCEGRSVWRMISNDRVRYICELRRAVVEESEGWGAVYNKDKE